MTIYTTNSNPTAMYYRNTKEMVSFEGVTVDAHSLWKREGQLMVLVDDDQYVSAAYEEQKFYLITNP